MQNITPMGEQEAPEIKIDPFSESGVTGLDRTGQGYGYVEEEWLRDLRGQRQAIRHYREISDNNAVVNSVLFLMDSLVRGLDWEVDKGKSEDEEEAQRQADFVLECISDIRQSWPNLIGEIIRNVVIYGWDTQEITFKRRNGTTDKLQTTSDFDDGKIGWGSIAPRSPDSREAWAFDETGRAVGLYQMAAPNYKITYIPIEKLLHVTSIGSAKQNPEGRSCLRGCYVSYYCLKRIQQSEMIGISRNLQGVPCMEVPIQLLSPSATAQEKLLLDKFQQMVSRVKSDEYSGLVIPAEVDQAGKATGYKFKLLQTGSTGKTVEINQTIERLERSIARAFLADWLYLGSGAGSSGSWSLASVRTHSFAQALAGFLASVVDAFNTHAIPQLMRMNGITDPGLFPKMRHGDIESRPIEEIAPHVASLVTSGLMTPDEDTEKWLRDVMGAPEMQAEEIRRPLAEDLPLDEMMSEAEDSSAIEETEDPEAQGGE